MNTVLGTLLFLSASFALADSNSIKQDNIKCLESISKPRCTDRYIPGAGRPLGLDFYEKRCVVQVNLKNQADQQVVRDIDLHAEGDGTLQTYAYTRSGYSLQKPANNAKQVVSTALDQGFDQHLFDYKILPKCSGENDLRAD